MNYVVTKKNGIKILMENVSTVFSNGTFVEFYNGDTLEGAFNIDEISDYIKIDNPEAFKTLVVTTSIDGIQLSDIHDNSLTSMKSGDFKACS